MLYELILICYLSSGMSIDNLGDWEFKKITGTKEGAVVEISRKVGDGHVLKVPKWCSIVQKQASTGLIYFDTGTSTFMRDSFSPSLDLTTPTLDPSLTWTVE